MTIVLRDRCGGVTIVLRDGCGGVTIVLRDGCGGLMTMRVDAHADLDWRASVACAAG